MGGCGLAGPAGRLAGLTLLGDGHIASGAVSHAYIVEEVEGLAAGAVGGGDCTGGAVPRAGYGHP